MAEGERRVSVIHQSLTRPILLAGAERPLAIANWITAAALIFGGGLHLYTVAMGAFLLTVGHWALVQAAKFDPHLSQVYVRHIRYSGLLSGARPNLRIATPYPRICTDAQGDARVGREGKKYVPQRVQGFKTKARQAARSA